MTSSDADVVMASIWFNGFEAEILDFTYPTYQVSSKFLVPRPIPLPLYTYILQPLETKAWILVLVMVLFTALSIYIIGILNKDNHGFINVFLKVLGILLATHNPIFKTALLNYCLYIWALTSLLLSTTYSAGFTFSGIIPKYQRNIQTFADGNQYDFKCFSTSNINGALVNSGEEDKILFSYKVSYNATDGFNYPCVFVDVMFNKYVMQANVTNLNRYKLLKEDFQEPYLVLGLKKNSPLTKIFNEDLLKLQEAGILNYWFFSVKYLYEYKDLASVSEMTAKSSNVGTEHVISLIKLYYAFAVLIIGYILSSVSFLEEKMYNKIRSS